MTKREFPDVNVLVAVRGRTAASFAVEPPTVRVVLRGRTEVLDSLSADKLQAFVACYARDCTEGAELPVQVALPSGVDASVEVEPPTVRVWTESGKK